jgi:putative FmdB family regulatory protein
VPTYEYQCKDCRREFEVRQRISEPALTRCETCGGTLKRLLSAAPFILKGEGWYVTDYPSASRKKALESEKSSATAGKKDGSTDKASAEKSSTPTSAASPSAPASTGAPASTPSKPSSTDSA